LVVVLYFHKEELSNAVLSLRYFKLSREIEMAGLLYWNFLREKAFPQT
jgi:hypothetical protein